MKAEIFNKRELYTKVTRGTTRRGTYAEIVRGPHYEIRQLITAEETEGEQERERKGYSGTCNFPKYSKLRYEFATSARILISEYIQLFYSATTRGSRRAKNCDRFCAQSFAKRRNASLFVANATSRPVSHENNIITLDSS